MYTSGHGSPVHSPTVARTRDSPVLSSAPSPSSASTPTSPTGRTGRLRGLSYLRNHHLLSRESHNNNSSSSNQQRPPTLGRATSYPLATSPPTSSPRASATAATSPPPAERIARHTSPTAQRSTTDLRVSSPDTPAVGPTSGWLPTVGGHSGVSRIATEPQSTDTASSSAVLSSNSPSTVTSELAASMARTRSATVGGGAQDMPQLDDGGETPRNRSASNAILNGTNGTNGDKGMAHQLPSIRFVGHQDPRAQRPSLVFSPMSRILPSGKEVIKVGRYSERDMLPIQPVNMPSAAPVGFKSKVVSRRHCEFWCSGGRWFIKDVKSSSGTFLNHIRLSSPGTESKPFPVNDGDIVQLGIDFKGGEEMIFRCVKIRVELNKGWQNGPSSFNVQSHKRLRELNSQGKPSSSGSSQDCSICLGQIAPCQSLFVAPCSHTWHYKCIRVIINGPHWPHFICPNCRAVADLEAELEEGYTEGESEEVQANDALASTGPMTPTDSRESVQQAQVSEQIEELLSATREYNSRSHIDQSSEEMEEIEETSEDSDSQGAPQVLVDRTRNITVLSPPPASRSASRSTDSTTVLSNPATHGNSRSTNLSGSNTGTDSSIPPINIIPRKAPPTASTSTPKTPISLVHGNYQAQSSNSRPNGVRNGNRTPSPSNLLQSSDPLLLGVEGPMTPRNDVGPFIFDGSAGREGTRFPSVPTTEPVNGNGDPNRNVKGNGAKEREPEPPLI